MEPIPRWTGLLDRADWRRMSIEAAPPPTLVDDQIELQIEQLAITANTVTYAVLGDRMHYWKLFPTDSGRGIVPAWGTAIVRRSRRDDLPVGTRLYGIWPTASHAVLSVGRVHAQSVSDASPHRQPLFPIYNQYERLAAPSDNDALRCVFRPLLVTATMLQDALAEHAFHGAEQILLSSASAKTALLSAWCLAQGSPRPQRIVGITSTPNIPFLRGLQVYDQVADYAELESLPAEAPSVLLDFAGNGDFSVRVHRHFGAALRASLQIGKSHWSAHSAPELPGPRPQLFFAPAQIAKRMQDWGPGGFARHVAAIWDAVLAVAPAWTQIRVLHGADGLCAAWAEMVAGRTPAAQSLVVRLDSSIERGQVK